MMKKNYDTVGLLVVLIGLLIGIVIGAMARSAGVAILVIALIIGVFFLVRYLMKNGKLKTISKITENKKRLKIILIVIASVLALIIILSIIGIFVARTQPVSNAKEYWKQKKYDKAIVALDNAIIITKESYHLKSKYLNEYMDYLIDKKDYKKADKIMKKYSDNLSNEYTYEIALKLYNTSMYKDAFKELKKLEELSNTEKEELLEQYDKDLGLFGIEDADYTDWLNCMANKEYEKDNFSKTYELAVNSENGRYLYVCGAICEKWSLDKVIASIPIYTLKEMDIAKLGDALVGRKQIARSDGTESGANGYYGNKFFGYKTKGNKMNYDFHAFIGDTDPDPSSRVHFIHIYSDESSSRIKKGRGDKWFKAMKKGFGVKRKDMKVTKTKSKMNWGGSKMLYKSFKWEKNGMKYSCVREYYKKGGRLHNVENHLIIDTRYHNTNKFGDETLWD